LTREIIAAELKLHQDSSCKQALPNNQSRFGFKVEFIFI
jgi:hypothetical protein